MPPDPDFSTTMATRRQDIESEVMAMPFRFLDLPAEIRLRVLEYALTDGTETSTIKLVGGDWDSLPHIPGADLNTDPPSSCSAKPNAQLLLTCRQLNAEGTPILYSKNIFSLKTSGLDGFTRIIGAANRQRIHSIQIGVPGFNEDSEDDLRSLKHYIGLERVRVDVLRSPSYSCLLQFMLEYNASVGLMLRMSLLPALVPLIKMLCERKGSEEAARKVIEVLLPSGCEDHAWKAVPCTRCCVNARSFEDYKIVEDKFWNDIPEERGESRRQAKRKHIARVKRMMAGREI